MTYLDEYSITAFALLLALIGGFILIDIMTRGGD